MRKILFGFLILTLLTASYLYFFPSRPPEQSSYCPFCDPEVLNRQKFYEDDLVIALYTHKPIFPGHCLIIPKRHITRFEETTDPEFTHMGAAIRKVNQAVMQVFGTYPYLLLQKNGYEVGQSVPHIHIHYIPRKTGDSSELKFLARMYLAHMEKPISQQEMDAITEKLKAAI